MEDPRVICEKCGVEYGIADYPFCKGGHGRYGVAIVDDQLEGGARWCETMSHEPVWLDGTKSQWRQMVDKHQVRNVVRHESTYYERQRRRHMEELKDTGQSREY